MSRAETLAFAAGFFGSVPEKSYVGYLSREPQESTGKLEDQRFRITKFMKSREWEMKKLYIDDPAIYTRDPQNKILDLENNTNLPALSELLRETPRNRLVVITDVDRIPMDITCLFKFLNMLASYNSYLYVLDFDKAIKLDKSGDLSAFEIFIFQFKSAFNSLIHNLQIEDPATRQSELLLELIPYIKNKIINNYSVRFVNAPVGPNLAMKLCDDCDCLVIWHYDPNANHCTARVYLNKDGAKLIIKKYLKVVSNAKTEIIEFPLKQIRDWYIV